MTLLSSDNEKQQSQLYTALCQSRTVCLCCMLFERKSCCRIAGSLRVMMKAVDGAQKKEEPAKKILKNPQLKSIVKNRLKNRPVVLVSSVAVGWPWSRSRPWCCRWSLVPLACLWFLWPAVWFPFGLSCCPWSSSCSCSCSLARFSVYIWCSCVLAWTFVCIFWCVRVFV